MPFFKYDISSPLKLKPLRDFVSVNLIYLALKPLELFKNFYIAKYLNPSDFGIYKSFELITLLNKYGNFGLKSVASREVGSALAQKEFQYALKKRSTIYPAEISIGLIIFIIGLLSTIFVESNAYIIFIILASLNILLAKIRGVFSTESGIQKRFILISYITFISSVVGIAIIILTVPKYKIISIFIANIVVSITAIIIYVSKLKFRVKIRQFDIIELKKDLKTGITLSLSSLSEAVYKYSERLYIIFSMGTEFLGFFSLSYLISSQVIILLKTGARVRIQDIYELVGKAEYEKVHKIVIRESLLILGLSLVTIPIGYYGIEWLIPLYLPNWTNTIIYAQMFLLIIPFEVIHLYPTNVLISKQVNKQSTILKIKVFSTSIYLILILFLNFFYQNSLIYMILAAILISSINFVLIIFYYFKDFYLKYNI